MAALQMSEVMPRWIRDDNELLRESGLVTKVKFLWLYRMVIWFLLTFFPRRFLVSASNLFPKREFKTLYSTVVLVVHL